MDSAEYKRGTFWCGITLVLYVGVCAGSVGVILALPGHKWAVVRGLCGAYVVIYGFAALFFLRRYESRRSSSPSSDQGVPE